MRLIWLVIIVCSAVVAKTDNSDGFELERIMCALETMQNNVRSLEHTVKTYGTKVDQLSAQLEEPTKTATAKIDQLKHVVVEESRCPENGENGVFQLKLPHSPPFQVYCENDWIVIHRRFNGSLDFNQNWGPYREGFGDLRGEHWLGLEKMHQITREGSYELMVVLKSFDDVVKTAKYEGFRIGSESEQYRLDYVRFSGGGAGNSLEYHKTMKFSTPDRDNDSSCPTFYKKRLVVQILPLHEPQWALRERENWQYNVMGYSATSQFTLLFHGGSYDDSCCEAERMK